MPKPKNPLQFDPREIALVFSLFVFVCLLMFTVGILVGKGLSHSRQPTSLETSETTELHEAPTGESGHEANPHTEGKAEHGGEAHEPATKSSHLEKAEPQHDKKTENSHESAATSHADPHVAATPPASEHTAGGHAEAAHTGKTHEEVPKKTASHSEPEREISSEKNEDLELIPMAPPKTDWTGTSLKNGKSKIETETLLKNPKILALTEKSNQPSQLSIFKEKAKKSAEKKSPEKKSRSTASLYGESDGPFAVQVGSYPNVRDAEERVKFLKSQGFAHAHFSAKDLGDSSGKWYRVWLGYYPDYEAAQSSGKKLQNEGEVRNYLVRKADLENGVN